MYQKLDEAATAAKDLEQELKRDVLVKAEVSSQM